MLFNSGLFLKFFAGFLLLYYLVRQDLKARNLLILAASYLFYGWWDARFLVLLILTSLLDYAVGIGLDRLQDQRKRKLLLAVSITANLSLLGFFKYYGFFVDSMRALLDQFDIPFNVGTLSIILPVGISFYTFQSMSYAIDVYRREIPATRNLIHFLAYVSFFPQLVAGPIQRAHQLLPQFGQTRVITRPMLEEGIWLGLWGLFKKVVLADNLAPLVDMVYQQSSPPGAMVILATVAFGLQIYCDFSGYSDIARGTARILGFDVMFNFNLPYVSSNIREFWGRWHISLSTWLRDYLYISLGGNRRGDFRTAVNLLVTMLLGGLWHGASWNFVLWGLWHGCGLVIHRFLFKPAARESGGFKLGGWLGTMLFVFYGWLLFRAGSAQQVATLTAALGNFQLFAWSLSYVWVLAAVALPLVMMELWQKTANNMLVALGLPVWGKAALQSMLLISIILFWEKAGSPFIYFQF